ncbi:hypothetical protein F1559_003772 [Cyanidiococcus yangmingshanensis]|uniref:Uncharacterized protein n=1 Tax=Cyanidiococcus yangmingshanensis TaxID=2690220 RepID=A0A7J7IMW1_9RHOD|nr:hypothetical protein F1559_003772 [Cyanidiococcus yangmingshanensis]
MFGGNDVGQASIWEPGGCTRFLGNAVHRQDPVAALKLARRHRPVRVSIVVFNAEVNLVRVLRRRVNIRLSLHFHGSSMTPVEHFGERVYELGGIAMDTLTEASLSTPPRWRSLVRFPLVARTGSALALSSRRCGYDSDVITSNVQLCACGDRFVLATRAPAPVGTPSPWTVCVGRRWLRPGASEPRPDFQVWQCRWPSLETSSTPNTGRKRRWFWRPSERTSKSYWSYEFALNTSGRFIYGLAFSPGNKFRLDWLSVAEIEAASDSGDLQAPRIESVWLELPPGVFAAARANSPDPVVDRIVLWSIDHATKRAFINASNTLPNETLFGHDEDIHNDEMKVDPNDDVLHIYTAKGWHLCWNLDHQTGAPRHLQGVATSLGVTVYHGWRQYNADAHEMQTWVLCRREPDPSEPEWVLFGMPQQRQIASWCNMETFGGHQIDVGVISLDGSLLLCASSEIRRVAIYDLRHMNREPLQWTCAERVLRAVPWTQHGILLALVDDDQDQPSGRLEGWLWRPRTHTSPNGPERVFSLDWSALLPTDTKRSASDPQDGDEAMESGSSSMTSGSRAEPRCSDATAPDRSTSVSGTTAMAFQSRWKWFQWRLSRERGDVNERPSPGHGCTRLEHLVIIDGEHALALMHDQQHGHLVYLEQPSWVSALAETLEEHDWEHARTLLASMAIPEPMLALLRWRCSLRDADAARELVAALPEAWRWVAAHEAFQNQATAASAERVLLRAGCSSSPMPAEVASRLGVRPETFLERERLVNALAAPTTAAAETMMDAIRRKTMLLYQRGGLEAAVNYLGACGAFDAILALRKQEAARTWSLASVLQTIPLTADPHRYANLIEEYARNDADPMAFGTWCLERADNVDTYTGSLRHVQRLLALAVSLLDDNQNNANSFSVLKTRETLSKHLQTTIRMREALQWELWQRDIETLSWRRFVSLTPSQLLGHLLIVTLLARRTARPSMRVPTLSEVLGSDLIMHMLEGCRADEAHVHLEAALNEVLCCRSTELGMVPASNLEEIWLEAMVEALQKNPSCALCEVLEWHEEPFSVWCWSRLARTTLYSLPLTHQEARRLGAAFSLHHEADLMLETLALSEALTRNTDDQAYRRRLRQWLWQARIGRLSAASDSEQNPSLRKQIRQCFVEHAQEGSQSALARLETLLERHGLQMSPIERLSCLVASYRGEASVANLVIESIQRMVDSTEAASLLWRVALYCFEEESYPLECADQLLQCGANLWRRGSVSQQIRARALVQIVRMLVACRELGLPSITPRRLAWRLGPAVWIWHFHRLLEMFSDGSADDAMIQVASLAQLETAVEWLLARCARADPLALAYYPPTALDRLRTEDRCVAMQAITDKAKRVAFVSGSRPARAWIALARHMLREAGPWQSQVQRVLYDCLTGCGSLPIDLTWIQRYYGSEPCPATSVQVPCSSSPVAIAQEAQRHRLAIPAILYRAPLDRLDPEIWLDTCIAIWVLRQPSRLAAGRATLLPPAGDIRRVTCTLLAEENAAPRSQAGASALAIKFRAAAQQICEAYHWVVTLDTSAATADMDSIEKRVRRFLRDHSYREEVVAASLAHTVAPDQLEELAQPVIESAARNASFVCTMPFGTYPLVPGVGLSIRSRPGSCHNGRAYACVIDANRFPGCILETRAHDR